jgi:protease I
MLKVVIITAQNFQDEEVIYPFYRLQEVEDCQVDLATPNGEVMYGKYGVPARANVSVQSLNADDYDLVVIPGGFEAPDRLRIIKEATDFVAQMDKQNKLIATICHGAWVCISAKIMKGKKATCYIAVKDDLENAGAEYVDANIVVDKNMISSPHYRDNPIWMKTVVQELEKLRK